MTEHDYSQLRVNYGRQPLDSLLPTPLAQFEAWFADALTAGITEPNAMALATSDANNQPTVRHVLLKQADARGFVFYTNYQSRKGQALAQNPQASAVFPWFAMYRQIIIVGSVEKVSREESLEYFKQRPYGSQIGAHASEQSAILDSRQELDQRWHELEEKYPTDVPLPTNWGGYVIVPQSIELWAGRESRLHDRLRYVHNGVGAVDLTDPRQWRTERLAP